MVFDESMNKTMQKKQLFYGVNLKDLDLESKIVHFYFQRMSC